MKKLILVVLTLLLVISVTACSGENSEISDVTEEKCDITSYLNDGILSNAEFTIGSPISSLEEKYIALSGKEHSEYIGENEEEVFDKIEGFTSFHYVFNDCLYYYRKTKADLGVGYIVTFSDTLGFSVGESTLTDVKSSVTPKLKQKTADENEDLFFFDYLSFDNAQILYAEKDGKVLNFIFSDDILIAVAIYDTAIWAN